MYHHVSFWSVTLPASTSHRSEWHPIVVASSGLYAFYPTYRTIPCMALTVNRSMNRYIRDIQMECISYTLDKNWL